MGISVGLVMVVVPYVSLIVEKAPDKAKKAFDFFEEMEKSGDPRIAEVLEFTVLENLLTEDKNKIPKYVQYFGDETKIAAKAVGKWFTP